MIQKVDYIELDNPNNKKTVATNNSTVFLFNFAFNYLNIICYGN